MMQDFAGKTALVTGRNSGTGKAAAQKLAGARRPRDSQRPGQGPR